MLQILVQKRPDNILNKFFNFPTQKQYLMIIYNFTYLMLNRFTVLRNILNI